MSEQSLPNPNLKILMDIGYGINAYYFKAGECHGDDTEARLKFLVDNKLIFLYEGDTNRFKYLPSFKGLTMLMRLLLDMDEKVAELYEVSA